MLNRNAEALFWIGRYMERAENHARLIDVHFHLLAEDTSAFPRADEDDMPRALCKWGRIVDALGSREAYEQQYGDYAEQDVVHYITLDRDNANSLVTCVNHARDNVRTLREKLPSELWDVTNGFYLWLREKHAGDLTKESPHQFFGRIKEWTALFHGVTQSIMPRENEWHFIECGRFLERTENTLRIIQSAVTAKSSAAPETEDYYGLYPYLQAVLRSVSGYQAFRRHYADGVSAEAIIEFLVLNEVFPRSVHFSLHALDEHLRGIQLHEKQLRSAHDRIIRQVVKLKAELACLEREDLQLDQEGIVTGRLLSAAGQLGASFAQTFFRIGEATA
ncbi:alpha-E domain-containing protein [Paenibacillus sacheonensis]|uniref:Alpha-E domain-containing protein n=1 Tax=Paenibacillus sacheonensis TaxID=742054 RepID=A0A7X4YNN3_9BACL|nr:alpha-E domain-containing protein [Paenibacillus sacheonensis]MBM7565369.1 putative alpha-E superfamily protein [Paenibacillus sacheonensis]NBC69703.1 alpha-E domain-containing protein [Paenibacillus sacheonensis]